MELSDLRIFKAVVEEGGILRAARKLHRVQSNITTRIKQLEASLGAQLCNDNLDVRSTTIPMAGLQAS